MESGRAAPSLARSGGDAVAGGLRPTHPKGDDDEPDDVAGHLSGALGSKKKTDGDA